MLYRGAVALRTAGALNHVSKSDRTVISGPPATGCMASSRADGALLETRGQFVASRRLALLGVL